MFFYSKQKLLLRLQQKQDINFHNNIGCILYNSHLATVATGGVSYGIITVKFTNGDYKNIYTHRLMYMLENDLQDLPDYSSISHLCNNSLCMAPTHLSLEPMDINNSKKVCFKNISKQCTGHDPYPPCLL